MVNHHLLHFSKAESCYCSVYRTKKKGKGRKPREKEGVEGEKTRISFLFFPPFFSKLGDPVFLLIPFSLRDAFGGKKEKEKENDYFKTGAISRGGGGGRNSSWVWNNFSWKEEESHYREKFVRLLLPLSSFFLFLLLPLPSSPGGIFSPSSRCVYATLASGLCVGGGKGKRREKWLRTFSLQ